MKRSVVMHSIFLFSYFIFISIFRNMLSLDFTPFWVGAVLGALIPAVDYLLYVYVFNPRENISQQVNSLVTQGKTIQGMEMLSRTNIARESSVILHTANFQLFFAVFAFWVITSSTNLLGKGLVLALLLHLMIDQLSDLLETKDVSHWFRGFVLNLTDKEKQWYIYANLIYLLVLGFLI